MRSLLFAPANRPDLMAKLSRPGADAVALDLEDGTPLAEKEAARATAVEGAAGLAEAGGAPPIFVRTNPQESPLFEGDLAAVLAEGVLAVDGVVVPKVESAAQIVALERAMTQLERAAGLPPRRLIVGIESGAGVEYATEILSASSRACAVYFGAEDYATDVGARRTAPAAEVAYARARVVLSARLADLPAIDQAVIEVRDDERYLVDAAAGRDLGYGGKLCVHPAQVALAHRVFTPSEEELDRSRRLLETYERSMAEGRATVEFEGQMIDTPLVERARALIGAAGR
jgi:citrate lyase subunit beta/citryl-CoA lyase